MMVGTVVRMVVMMSPTEAHKLSDSLTKQVDLYLTWDCCVKSTLGQRQTLLISLASDLHIFQKTR
jgi:hypothetical protein